MRRLGLAGVFILGVTLPLVGCDMDVEDEGRLPDVDVDATPGELPEVDVEGPDIDVDSERKQVEVPDVDIGTETETITVPDVDVDIPEE